MHDFGAWAGSRYPAKYRSEKAEEGGRDESDSSHYADPSVYGG